MKIKIESDVFDIVKRIKEIDDGYFIMYDLNKNKYELHNSNQSYNTYCFTYPYMNLDLKMLDLILYSSISNIDNIIEDIDNNNRQIEKCESDKRQNQTKFMVKEIYNFCNNSSKDFGNKAFSTEWR